MGLAGQLQATGAHRVPRQLHFAGAEGGHDEETQARQAGRHRPQHLDAGGVRPLQVLEQERNREDVGRPRGHEVHGLPQHALAGDPDGLLLEGLEDFRGGRGGRELQAPGRGVGPQELERPLAGRHRPREKGAQQVEDGQVGFARAVVLDAATARDRHPRIQASPAQELVRERGLADPRLAGDEDEVATALLGLGEESFELLDLGLASDQHLALGKRGRRRDVRPRSRPRTRVVRA